MTEKVLCARCGQKCVGKYVYMSAIDTNLICQDCWNKEQPKELTKRIAELEEQNKKLAEQLKTKDTINNLYKNTLELKNSDFSDLVYENANLKKENAKLQEQLTNAIVPKYKPCDYVYAITPRRAKKIQKCFVHKVEIEPIAGYLSISYLVIELGDNESVSDLKESGEDWFYSKFAEKALFTTEAEAQKYLEERK